MRKSTVPSFQHPFAFGYAHTIFRKSSRIDDHFFVCLSFYTLAWDCTWTWWTLFPQPFVSSVFFFVCEYLHRSCTDHHTPRYRHDVLISTSCIYVFEMLSLIWLAEEVIPVIQKRGSKEPAPWASYCGTGNFAISAQPAPSVRACLAGWGCPPLSMLEANWQMKEQVYCTRKSSSTNLFLCFFLSMPAPSIAIDRLPLGLLRLGSPESEPTTKHHGSPGIGDTRLLQFP